MNALQKRFLLFLGVCIPVRLGLVYLAKNIQLKYLPALGYLALLPAIGFLYLFVTGKRQTGVETQGAPIWWARFRILHGLNYFLFAVLAILRKSCAYQVLLFDVMMGITLFLINHVKAGNFAKVFK